MRIAAGLGHLRACQRGAAAVEFALIAMVAISLFLGIIEVGRAFYVRNALSYAADIAARTILINPAATDSALESIVRSSVTLGGSEGMALTFGRAVVDGVFFRTVSVSKPLTLLIPKLTSARVTLTINRRVPLL